MTRTDYRLIAEALHRAKPMCFAQGSMAGWLATVQCLADAFAKADERFDRKKFLEMAGANGNH